MVAGKVTLTLPADLLAAVDRYIEGRAGVTRSSICAEALRAWLRANPEVEIANYYINQSEEERTQDTAWANAAAESADALWR